MTGFLNGRTGRSVFKPRMELGAKGDPEAAPTPRMPARTALDHMKSLALCIASQVYLE